MEYIPKKLEGNVNVSKINPVKEFFLLLFGVTGVLVIVYILLGLAVEFSIRLAPVEIEQALAKVMNIQFSNAVKNKDSEHLMSIAEELKRHIPETIDFYETIDVRLIPSSQINAYALPGGVIAVNTALYRLAVSDSELAYVLAHEMGHFAAKDNLKGFGRSIVFVSISVAMLGRDSAVTKALLNIVKNAELTFSREQENRADRFAMDLIYTTYGKVDGVLTFMEKMAEKDDISPVLQNYFSTHSSPRKRLEYMRNYEIRKHYEKEIK